MKCAFFFLAFLLVFLLPASAQLGQQDPIQVKRLAVTQAQTAGLLKIECILDMPAPYHVNSDSVPQPYLIPTRILPADSVSGVLPAHRKYPKPLRKTLFGQEIAVFEGEIAFSEFFQIKKGIGFPLFLELQYQACDNTMCYPPRRQKILVSQVGKTLQAQLIKE